MWKLRRRSRKTQALLLMATLAQFLAIEAQAVPAQLIEDNRFVHDKGFSCDWDSCYSNWDDLYEPDSPFADFNHDYQTSVVTPLLMTAVGSAYGADFYESGNWLRRSTFSIVFDLVETTEAHLEASLASNSLGLAYVSLEGPYGVLVNWTSGDNSSDFTLAPGRYTIAAVADNPNTWPSRLTASYDMSLTLTSIPEPGTALLLGIGLGLMSLRSRRD